MLIAQLTDPHIKACGSLAYKKVDTAENLKRCVKHIGELSIPPDVVLITGDLTDFGRPEEYALLRELIAPLDMPIFLIPGNHDTREGIKQAFPDHEYLPMDSQFLHYVVDDFPLRLIGLDTTIAGKPEGVMCTERLNWLHQQLSDEPDSPTILFMHHPPIETGIRHMDVQNCGNADALGAVVEQHKQIVRILCGHVHRPIYAQWFGITVTIAPSSSHNVAFDLQDDSSADFILEPPTLQLHHWRNDTLISHLSFIGEFDGPHPFYDEEGNLID